MYFKIEFYVSNIKNLNFFITQKTFQNLNKKKKQFFYKIILRVAIRQITTEIYGFLHKFKSRRMIN